MNDEQAIAKLDRLTADDYQAAFRAIRDQLHESDLRMLKAHYEAPDYVITATALANEAGFDAYKAANLRYGLLAQKLLKEFQIHLSERVKVNALVCLNHPEDQWEWTLRPQVVEALKQLGRSWLSVSQISEESTKRGSVDNMKEFTQIIERTKWKFAWTYARTYPHEYTTKDLSSPGDHKKLISCIERDGVIERFGESHRKYFHFEGRKYWHMGNPRSKVPEEWPNVINRTWEDVRRHAENVKHRWTSEEVKLQMRLWEIQLEKSTDRAPLKTDEE